MRDITRKAHANTLWLLHQGFIFVRDYEHLTGPPFNIQRDEAFVDRLVTFLSRLLLTGLSGVGTRPA